MTCTLSIVKESSRDLNGLITYFKSKKLPNQNSWLDLF